MPEIGDQLRETRLRNRIDITEVEAATKIRAKYLRALENEEWNLLPGPTFVKTFLRTYADYLRRDAMTPWLLIGLGLVLLVGALFVIGSWGDDDTGDEQAATPTPAASAAAGGKKKKKDKQQRKAAAPTVVRLQIQPT